MEYSKNRDSERIMKAEETDYIYGNRIQKPEIHESQ